MTGVKGLAKYGAISLLAMYAWVRLKLVRRPTLLILTYHRVLPDGHPDRELEQPGMIVAPDILHRHIRFVKRLGAVPMHLDEWIERKKGNDRTLPPLSVAFTFDDGWQDNHRYAYPVLKDEGIPATIFLVTGMIDTSETFWPERVIKLLRAADSETIGEAPHWLHPYLPAEKKPLPGARLSMSEVDQVITRLKALDDATIVQSLNQMEKGDSSSLEPSDNRAILSKAELSEMAESALIKFGAHTRKHSRLNRVESHEALHSEIVGCLKDLTELHVPWAPIFCYPNGDISTEGERLVAEHYAAACTTKTGWNTLDDSEYALTRYNLHDGNSGTTRSMLATIGRGLLPVSL